MGSKTSDKRGNQQCVQRGTADGECGAERGSNTTWFGILKGPHGCNGRAGAGKLLPAFSMLALGHVHPHVVKYIPNCKKNILIAFK